MSKPNSIISVPKSMEMKYAEIAALTDNYCVKNLNEEYAQLVRLAIATLCRKKLSPIQLGSTSIWACGVIWAVGFVNFLFDKSSSPYVSAEDLANAFGTAKSTAGNKSKQIRELLKMKQFDHRWCLPSRIENSSMAWTIMCNGFMVDARTLHRDIQEAAYKKGLIAYIHADRQ